MFAEWASLSPIIAANSNGAQSKSVLNKFSGPAGREVTIAVTKQLATNLGFTQPAEPSSLTNDEEVSVITAETGLVKETWKHSVHNLCSILI